MAVIVRNRNRYGPKKSQDLILIDTGGFSMWPFLRPGQKLIIKKVSLRDLRIGDIILYKVDNQLICHRLLKITTGERENLLYVCGDNSATLPELVTEEMFLGKAIGALRNGKMVNLTGRKQQFINRFIVEIAPLVRIFKPYYVMLRKVLRD
jgi:signal peptidase I